MGHAVRQTAQPLRHNQRDSAVRRETADQIERLSEQLRDKDVSELVRDAQRLERRQLTVFLGGDARLGPAAPALTAAPSPTELHGTGRRHSERNKSSKLRAVAGDGRVDVTSPFDGFKQPATRASPFSLSLARVFAFVLVKPLHILIRAEMFVADAV